MPLGQTVGGMAGLPTTGGSCAPTDAGELDSIINSERKRKLEARMEKQSGSNSATGLSNDGFDVTSLPVASTASSSSVVAAPGAGESAPGTKRKAADESQDSRQNRRKQTHPSKIAQPNEGSPLSKGGAKNKTPTPARSDAAGGGSKGGPTGQRPVNSFFVSTASGKKAVEDSAEKASGAAAAVGAAPAARKILGAGRPLAQNGGGGSGAAGSGDGGSVGVSADRERELKAQLAATEEEVADLRALSAQLETESNLAKEASGTASQRYVVALTEMIRAQAHRDAAAARERAMRNIERIGYMRSVREGMTSIREHWVEGTRYLEIRARVLEIDQKEAFFEEQRKIAKSAMKARKSAAKVDAAFAVPATPEYNEELEIPALEIKMLKAERDGLKATMTQLRRDRNMHVRELKRIEDEDESRYTAGVEGKDTMGQGPKRNDRYLLQSLLGRGGFSEVFKAYDLVECRAVACKIHQVNPMWSKDKKSHYIEHATREYEIHKELHHTNVTELYDVFEIDDNSFCTVMEYCDGNDLDFQIKQNGAIPEKEAKCKLVQMVKALKYLNELDKPIIHYDLKPANVLLVDGVVKITDFGLAKWYEVDGDSTGMELTSQGAGTYWYLPPECFDTSGTPKISSRVDVWSIGVIYYQCLYGFRPFGDGQSQQEVYRQASTIFTQGVQFPDEKLPGAQAFIRACLSSSVTSRPTVLELAKHEYLHKK